MDRRRVLVRKTVRRNRFHIATLSFIPLLLLLAACGPKTFDNSLPQSSELGSPRGYRIARVITHFHSPYSYDACDKHGLSGDGTPNPSCLADLRNAVCTNRVDFLFLSDHPNSMENFEFPQLLLQGPPSTHDKLLMKNGLPYANQLGDCSNGFTPTLMAGFEGRLLALGMEQHLDPDITTRTNLYDQETFALRSQLQSDANALVVIPHTESRTVATIESLSPDGIEIYNFHANVDPKIRLNDLGLPPFADLPAILTYLIDPYHKLNPDFAFLGFVEVAPVYFQKWDQLIADGFHVTGLGGTDSHENIFPQTVSDGERLDSHRRIMRLMSNHYLVHSLDPDEVKAAIKAGRGWVVFEGLGSPVGMDFTATLGQDVYGVGDTVALGGAAATFNVPLPSLHSSSPQGQEKPDIHIELKLVGTQGSDTTVASSDNASLSYSTSTPGAYRAEISMVPHQLRDYLGDFSSYADQKYRWIITNHIYLTP